MGPTARLAAFLFLPFVLLGWMAPFVGPLTIGHDYSIYPIYNQLELQFALTQGEHPLFVPGFAAGVPAAALTLGQLYHPISHLAAALPGYWSGLALEWNTFLRLLSLGLAHLALYAFVRRIGLDWAAAFAVSFVTVYNLRMLDAFRYGASLESYTGMLLLTVAIGWNCFWPLGRLGVAGIAVATWLTLVGGHPQMAYFGLASGVLTLALAPWLGRAFGIATARSWRSAYAAGGAGMAFGLAMAAAYALPFALDVMPENGGRVAQDYAWAAGHSQSWSSLASNFVLPFWSDVHGAFGGSLAPLLAVGVLGYSLLSRRAPAPLLAIGGLILVTLVYSAGSATPLHRWAWEWLPFHDSFRAPGRAGMLLPVLFLWPLCWFFLRYRNSAKPLALALLALAGALCVFLALEPHRFSPAVLRNAPAAAAVVWAAIGAGSLAALARGGATGREAFCAGLAVQTGLALAYGTWVEPKRPTTTFVDYQQLRHQGFDYPSAYVDGMYSAATLAHLERTARQPEPARLYFASTEVASRTEAYRRIEQGRDAATALVEPCPGLGARSTAPAQAHGELAVRHASYNRMVYAVASTHPALLTLSTEYSPRWSVWVDGEPSALCRANGYQSAVMVPTGDSAVELKYQSPATAAGRSISTAAWLVLLAYVALGDGRARHKPAFALFALTAAFGLGMLWRAGFHGGRNLGMQYRWSSAQIPAASALFGARASASKHPFPEKLDDFHASRAVDGSEETYAVVADNDGIWWQAELGRPQAISELRITLEPARETHSRLRVTLFDPLGGVALRSTARFAPGADRSVVKLEKPLEITRVRLETPLGGQARFLALREVEAYGPQP